MSERVRQVSFVSAIRPANTLFWGKRKSARSERVIKQHPERYRRAIEALKAARKDAGLTQAELAQRLGSRQQFVSKYESGERRLDVIEYFEIARIIGLIPDQILPLLD